VFSKRIAPSSCFAPKPHVTAAKQTSTRLAESRSMSAIPTRRLAPATPRVGHTVFDMHRHAVAGPSLYVEASGGRGGETVLGLTSGPHAYHLYLDFQSGNVMTDLGLTGKRLEGPFSRRVLLHEEGSALRPALERLAAHAESLLSNSLRAYLPKSLREDDELVLSLSTACRLLRRFER
jgi:hypothetical protein